MEGTPRTHKKVSFKNKIQEYCEKRRLPYPEYKVRRVGPDHMPIFTAMIFIGNTKYVGNKKSTKKEAEQSAAKVAVIDLLYSNEEGEELKQLKKEKENWIVEKETLMKERFVLQEQLRAISKENFALADKYRTLWVDMQYLVQMIEEVGEN